MVYLANWNSICYRTWGVCNCYLQRGTKIFILDPLCEGALGPLPQRSRQTFLGRLRPTSQKTTLGRLVQAANLEFKKSVGPLVTPKCYKLAYWFEQRVNNCYVFVLLDLFREGWCLPGIDDLPFGQPTPPPANIWTVWARPAVEENKKPEKNTHEASFFKQFELVFYKP